MSICLRSPAGRTGGRYQVLNDNLPASLIYGVDKNLDIRQLHAPKKDTQLKILPTISVKVYGTDVL